MGGRWSLLLFFFHFMSTLSTRPRQKGDYLMTNKIKRRCLVTSYGNYYGLISKGGRFRDAGRDREIGKVEAITDNYLLTDTVPLS